jgi:alpha-L-fucosidase
MQSTYATDVRIAKGDSSWFTHDRFGLFIHWGLYALAARHEWVKQQEKMTNEEYEKYFKFFDPDLYDPAAWAKAAAAAGMKYFVITTKHHDGFCLWDSALTDYKATNTPAGRDLLRPMIDAFRAEGLRVGLYHSLIDWHHPHFVIDDMHALRHHPDREKLNQGRDQKKYIEYLHGQVRELLTDYGHIDMLFFDFTYPSREDWKNDFGQPFDGKDHTAWDSKNLVKTIRELQPHIVLNDRLGLWNDEDDWDYKTPEQFQPREWTQINGQRVVWEACQTFSGSWGYYRDEYSWKSIEQLLLMLIDSVAKGGNMLLNVGPTARGEFDVRALDRLEGMGEWMKRHSRSIYGCTQAPPEWKQPEHSLLTYNPERNRLYVHMLAWPFKRLYLDGPVDQVEYAQFLNDASEIKLVRGQGSEVHSGLEEGVRQGSLALDLPVQKPDITIPVIELFLK